MNYPADIEEKIGFSKIRLRIESLCRNQGGKELIRKQAFETRFGKIKAHFETLNETQCLLEEFPEFRTFLYYNDLNETLPKLNIEDIVFSKEELMDFKTLLESSTGALGLLKQKEDLSSLMHTLEQLTDFKELIEVYNRVFDKEGEISSTASPKLQEIQKGIVSCTKKLRKSTDSLMEKAKKDGYTADSGVTIRNGRPVLPILAFNKGKVSGVLHDRSASGSILYIEPYELMEDGNNLSELNLEHKAELFQIRKKLTNKLSKVKQELQFAIEALSFLDFLSAKASFAAELKCVIPILVKEPQIDWKGAYHPILKPNLVKENKKAIPLDIHINKEGRVVVLSGPNAGGKSIALKTIVLNQYMIQCGIPIPFTSGSISGVFSQIFIDIGDDQSVEANLSTYSSHLQSMKHFLSNANEKTLFFIDEFGTGTDPNFGGAMAEVILEELLKSGAMGMVTTHYSNLKNLSASKDGLINAAMLFEKEKLKPLYKLEQGMPGSSFTFEVATNIGLNPKVIKEAKRRLGKREKQAEELLVELENTKAQIRHSKSALSKKEEQLDLLLTEYTKLKEEILNRKKQILNEAKNEAKDILDLANKKVETTIKTIVESKANKKEVIKARASIKKQKQTLVPDKISESNFKRPLKLVIGMEVFLENNTSTKGTVIEVKKNEAQVVFGIIKGWFKNKDLLVRR